MRSNRKAARLERREVSAEFKVEAVKRVAERRAVGVTLAQVGRELDLRPDQLRAWARQQRGAPGGASAVPGETVEQENRRRRREVATLRQEPSVRKKSGGVLREGVAMRCAVIARPRGEFPVRLMGRALEVSSAGFDAYRKRPASGRAVIDERLMTHIRIAFAASGATYGAPRGLQELREAGLPTSTKRVARLMREDGWVARPRRRQRVVTTDSNHDEPIAPNRLARPFDVNGVAIHRVWIGDLTHVPTREGPLYLATVLDLGSRRCVGWAMRDTMEVELVVSALRLARAARRPEPGLIFHSDRGSQSASGDDRTELAADGMSASMSGPGDCDDTAVAERFFATLAFELLRKNDWPTRADARGAIFRYIETWSTRKRRHSTLGYVSPATYEAPLQAAALGPNHLRVH